MIKVSMIVISIRFLLLCTFSSPIRLVSSSFGVATLEGFGLKKQDPSLGAAAAVLHYLSETQKQSLTHLTALPVLMLTAVYQ